MAERKGASYRIKSTRPASSHAEHTQTTQATQWTNQYGELTAGLPGLKNWRPGSTSEAAYQESKRSMGPGQGVSAAGDRRAYEQAMVREPRSQPRRGGDFGKGPPLERNPEGRGYRYKRT
jgi:hypothetical protein